MPLSCLFFASISFATHMKCIKFTAATLFLSFSPTKVYMYSGEVAVEWCMQRLAAENGGTRIVFQWDDATACRWQWWNAHRFPMKNGSGSPSTPNIRSWSAFNSRARASGLCPMIEAAFSSSSSSWYSCANLACSVSRRCKVHRHDFACACMASTVALSPLLMASW